MEASEEVTGLASHEEVIDLSISIYKVTYFLEVVKWRVIHVKEVSWKFGDDGLQA